MLDPRLRDDNGFHDMPSKPTENDVDIHADAGRRAYRFGQGGNAGTGIRMAARNARFLEADADPGDPSSRPVKDVERPVRTMRRHFADETSRPSKAIAPDPRPSSEPWDDVPDNERQERWNHLIFIVISGGGGALRR